MKSLKNVTSAINYLTENNTWISTWEKCMEAQNTIAQIVTICLAFNQTLICMSRIFIQGEVRYNYRNLSFKTWYISGTLHKPRFSTTSIMSTSIILSNIQLLIDVVENLSYSWSNTYILIMKIDLPVLNRRVDGCIRLCL